MKVIQVRHLLILILCLSLEFACGQDRENKGAPQIETFTSNSSGEISTYTPQPLVQESQIEATKNITAAQSTATPFPTNIPLDNTHNMPEEAREQITRPDIKVIFSMSNPYQTIPEDIFQEILYFATGGGDLYYGECTNNSPSISPRGLHYYGGGHVFFPAERHRPLFEDEETRPAELGSYIQFLTCGWQTNESVKARVFIPDGRIRTIVVTPEELRNGISVVFRPLVGAPEGLYRFSFTGEQTTIGYSINVIKPNGPRVYNVTYRNALWLDGLFPVIFSAQNAPVKKNVYRDLLLYNFEPEERVKVLRYGDCTDASFINTHCLHVYQEFQVNSHGELIVKIPLLPFYYYFIVGDSSGTFDVSTTSGSSQPSTLKSFQAAILEKDYPLRQSASLEAPAVTQIPFGTVVKIIGQVAQYPSSIPTWYHIRLKNGLEGYIPANIIDEQR